MELLSLRSVLQSIFSRCCNYFYCLYLYQRARSSRYLFCLLKTYLCLCLSLLTLSRLYLSLSLCLSWVPMRQFCSSTSLVSCLSTIFLSEKMRFLRSWFSCYMFSWAWLLADSYLLMARYALLRRLLVASSSFSCRSVCWIYCQTLKSRSKQALYYSSIVGCLVALRDFRCHCLSSSYFLLSSSRRLIFRGVTRFLRVLAKRFACFCCSPTTLSRSIFRSVSSLSRWFMRLVMISSYSSGEVMELCSNLRRISDSFDSLAGFILLFIDLICYESR